MNYKLVIAASAQKTLDRLPRATRQRLVNAMRALRLQPRPRGTVKIRGEERMYRLRVGDYRILYDIYDDRLVILVLRVAHRKDAYRGM